MNIIEKDSVEPINTMIFNSVSQPLTGKTDIKVQIRRISDGFYLDWDDYTFKAGASVTQLLETLTEVSSTYSPGEYQGFFDTSAIVNYVDDDIYEVMVRQDGGVDASNLPQTGELKIGHWLNQLESMDTVVLQSYSLDPVNGILTALAWIEQRTLVLTTATSCQFKLYDSEGVEMLDVTDDAPDAQGFFKIENYVSLVKNRSYYATAAITLASSEVVSGGKGIFTIG